MLMERHIHTNVRDVRDTHTRTHIKVLEVTDTYAQ